MHSISLPVIDSCDGCGACCMQLAQMPFAPSEIATLPGSLQEEVRVALLQAEANDFNSQNCIWLDSDTQRCVHYEHRPLACRKFEIGTELCRNSLEYIKVLNGE